MFRVTSIHYIHCSFCWTTLFFCTWERYATLFIHSVQWLFSTLAWGNSKLWFCRQESKAFILSGCVTLCLAYLLTLKGFLSFPYGWWCISWKLIYPVPSSKQQMKKRRKYIVLVNFLHPSVFRCARWKLATEDRHNTRKTVNRSRKANVYHYIILLLLCCLPRWKRAMWKVHLRKPCHFLQDQVTKRTTLQTKKESTLYQHNSEW